MYISVFLTFSYNYHSIKVHLQQKSSIFNMSGNLILFLSSSKWYLSFLCQFQMSSDPINYNLLCRQTLPHTLMDIWGDWMSDNQVKG